MTDEDFSDEEYENLRNELIMTVQKNTMEYDKPFLLNVKNLTPDWSISPFEHFPAVQWKLRNLRQHKDFNPKKHLDKSQSDCIISVPTSFMSRYQYHHVNCIQYYFDGLICRCIRTNAPNAAS